MSLDKPTHAPDSGQTARRVTVTVAVPDELLHALGEQLADLLADRETGATPSPWLTLPAAAAYLGCSRDRLYKLTAAKAIPFRRRQSGQGILFHRDELDVWVDIAYERDGCAV